MKILVTGANGYVGKGVVKRLIDDGHTVLATDLKTDTVDERAQKYNNNLFEIEEPYSFFGKPDAILHLAWRDGFEHTSENHINDLPQHYHFLKKMIMSGIKHVCILGSMHEIGFFEGCIDEQTPTNPQSLYGISKNALRQSIKLLQNQYDFKFQWIRGFYIVGNVEMGSSVFSKIYKAEEEGENDFPFTLGENQFDFIDYDFFCNQVCAVVEQKNINGIINCCSGKPMKLRDRVEKFIIDNDYKINLNLGKFPDRSYDSKAVWGNDCKIKEILKNRGI